MHVASPPHSLGLGFLIYQMGKLIQRFDAAFKHHDYGELSDVGECPC